MGVTTSIVRYRRTRVVNALVNRVGFGRQHARSQRRAAEPAQLGCHPSGGERSPVSRRKNGGVNVAAKRQLEITAKVAHVLGAKQTRAHGCHWPGCKVEVPPAMWGCRKHWFALPPELRRRVWQTYRPGQEETLTPSRAYLDVADEVQRWIREHTAQRGWR